MRDKRRAIMWEYVESFVIAIALALIVRTFVIQPFKIPRIVFCECILAI